ncbi:hypothetical protein H5410_032748 [Solanum commersonii]|uniref:Fatty acyl-CoA reductase n=1 Tax=Solanum commersonii TaxID=4109 RepID=A0A9J5YLS8_SOLCO|nr:hypothetical protein H5410_032748 [Solanum commersonii]
MFEYTKNISSFENHKRARKKLVNMKSENIGHVKQYSQLKATQFQHGNGIGIVEFFEGKNILVTGATRFLAKALIEKMLRTTPKVNNIYILIKAKDEEAAFHRLASEIVESKLFKYLEEMHGESYKLFIQNKLVPVVGNIYEPNLRMDIITTQQIAQEIDLIVNSAPSQHLTRALDANVNGPRQLMMFAKKCNKLKLLMYYSTAYANGQREGMILEKPFTMGENITKEKTTSVSPFINFPSLYADNEIDLVSKLKNNVNNNGLEQLMKDLGAERQSYMDGKIRIHSQRQLVK